eukprot:m.58819 g.58819  ORF g.58819 m.58819 type:complete len:518 (+) comp7175_c0_seq1:249-1802(+)
MATLKPGQCICQICTCGRHHCRHVSARTRNVGECNFETTSRTDFVAKAGERAPSMKPAPRAAVSDAPFDGTTTYGGDFYSKSREFVPAQSTKKKEVYVPPREPLAGVSTTRQDYPAHSPTKTASCKPANQRQEPPPGDFKTTYSQDLGGYTPAERSVSFKPKQSYSKPSQPLDGTSSYAKDYPRHEGIARAPSMKPIPVVSESRDPMDARSVAHDTYTGQYVPPVKSCKPQANRSEPAPFEGLSTKQRDFTMHPIERTPSMKPANNAAISTDPFDARSTAAEEFQAWPISKTQSMKPQQRAYQGGEFYGEPTSRADFKEHPVTRTKSMKPVQEFKPSSSGSYETTYKNDMIQHPGERTRSFKPANQPIQTGEFSGTTEARDNFVHRTATPVKSQKPTQAYRPSSGPFHGSSSYGAAYVPHDLPCPATRFPPSLYQLCDCGAAHPHSHAHGCPASRAGTSRGSSSRTTSRASSRAPTSRASSRTATRQSSAYGTARLPSSRRSSGVQREILEIGVSNF